MFPLKTAIHSLTPLFRHGLMKQSLHTASRTTARSTTMSIGTTLSRLGLVVGATGVFALQSHASVIMNEAVNLGTINMGKLDSGINSLDPTSSTGSVTTSRYGGNLQYRQLCYGSMVGLFAGVVIGKLSSVLGFITLSAVLLLQFLQSRNIIHVPWTSIVRIGSDRVDLRQLFLEDPSFKLSFALTFIIAAFNI